MRTDYSKQDRITPICDNGGQVGTHFATYRGFTKNPSRVENKTNPTSDKSTNQALKKKQICVDILKDFNYT